MTNEFVLDPQRAEFVDAESEHGFRASIVGPEVRAFRLAMLVCGPFYLMFIVSDYFQLGLSLPFWVILAARLFVCVLALWLVGRLDHDRREDGEAVTLVYRHARLFFVVALGLAFVIYPLSGKSFVELYPGMIVMVMVAFFFIPARFCDRLYAALAALIGFNIEAILWMDMEARHLPMALLLMLATLVLGAVSSRYGAMLRRQHYVDNMLQQRLNRQLSEEVARRQRLQQEALVLAHSDPLTGIANRRHFMALAGQEVERVSRYGGTLSLMLLDIDYFKQVNDTHGHAVGDEVLKILVAVCHRVMRASDLFGRLGGDEFIMLLPHTETGGAKALADRLRQSLEKRRVNGSVRITVTIGLSEWRQGENIESMLRHADRALYQGKAAGRDRVVVAELAESD